MASWESLQQWYMCRCKEHSLSLWSLYHYWALDEHLGGDRWRLGAGDLAHTPHQVRETWATVLSPHWKAGWVADRRRPPLNQAWLDGWTQVSEAKKSFERLQEGHTGPVTIVSTMAPCLPNSQEQTALPVSKRLVLGHQISFSRGTEIIFDVPVFL